MWPRKPASRLVSFEFTANALENIKALAADPDTRPVAVAALRLAKQLGENPYLGEPLREKANLKPLAAADCRKLKCIELAGLGCSASVVVAGRIPLVCRESCRHAGAVRGVGGSARSAGAEDARCVRAAA